MHDNLAIYGGPRSCPQEYTEEWPLLTELDVNKVVEQLKSRSLSIRDGTGIIEEFERAYALSHESKYAVATCNGTAALQAALFACGIGIGDEVILPTNTWPATANAVFLSGAEPVLCDVDPRTLCMTAETIEKKLTERTKALILVHLWGHPCDVDSIRDSLPRKNIVLIEDASHAHFAKYNGKHVGTLGDVGCFSLQASKLLCAGEGGIAITNNPNLFNRLLLFGQMGRNTSENELNPLVYVGMGPKFRPHPLAIALAVSQLERAPEIVKSRNVNADYLTSLLNSISGIEGAFTEANCFRGAFYGYRAQLTNPLLTVDLFCDAMRAEGVPCQKEWYRLLHREPHFQPTIEFSRQFPVRWPYHARITRNYSDSQFPNAVKSLARLVTFPVYSSPCFEVLDNYAQAAKKVINKLTNSMYSK